MLSASLNKTFPSFVVWFILVSRLSTYIHLIVTAFAFLRIFLFTCLPFVYLDIRKEGNVLFNDVLNTFYLRLYGVRHVVNDHSDSERENPLPPHGLLFSINSKGSFICTIPQTG